MAKRKPMKSPATVERELFAKHLERMTSEGCDPDEFVESVKVVAMSGSRILARRVRSTIKAASVVLDNVQRARKTDG